MNLVLVEIIGVIFTVLFLQTNPQNDSLFILLVRIFILERVLGLVVLLLVIEKTGSDFIMLRLLSE